MAEAYVNGQRSEAADAQLSRQPTVDIGTPVDVHSAVLRLDGEGAGVTSAGMPPLLYSQAQPDDVKGELKSVDSMPQLMPISDMYQAEKQDVDSEGWVPMVSHQGRDDLLTMLRQISSNKAGCCLLIRPLRRKFIIKSTCV